VRALLDVEEYTRTSIGCGFDGDMLNLVRKAPIWVTVVDEARMNLGPTICSSNRA
jgi:hypothetical protein